MKKLCYVATIPAVVHAFLRGHIEAASEKYEVTVICNSTDKHLLEGLNAHLILLTIERKPSPLRDVQAFFQLLRLFRRERFDIVHSIMPKTGMVAMFAAWSIRVPTRIHTFTGQVWVTDSGASRILFKCLDKMIGRFATFLLADSPSQREFLINEGVLPLKKVNVIGAGSICGVASARFHPDLGTRLAVRNELGIAQDDIVILFVGRLNRDKGMLDLALAFSSIANLHQSVVLLLVGAEEDILFSRIKGICSIHGHRLRHVSFTPKPECYMASADIFCLPSYREGFGLTIIEAAACCVPAVASRIYGITDAVADGVTGLLIPPGDVDELTRALLKLISETKLRRKMGLAAYHRALKLFSSEKVTREMVALYDRLSGK